MSSPKPTYDPLSAPPSLGVKEEQVEYGFIGKLQNLKYEYRPDIRDRASLERNFREKLEALNRVHLSYGEFARLLDEIVTPDAYTAARTLRERNAFIVNALSHKKVYYYESDIVVPDNLHIFDEVMGALIAKYSFVLHAG